MTRLTCRFGLLLTASVLSVTGCAKPESSPAGSGKTPDRAATANEAPENGAKPAVDGSNRPAKVPETPDAAILAVVEGLKENKPQALWEFLPSGYQRDVNDLVHDFARRMDADLWNRGFKIARRIVKILETKRRFILESPLWKQSERVAVDEVAADLDAAAGLLGTLASSDMSDLEKLKEIDVGDFLAETGGSMMSQLSKLSAVTPGDPLSTTFQKNLSVSKTSVLRSGGDRSAAAGRATVKLEFAGEPAKTEEVEFVRIEGKWIPKRLADQWNASIEAAKQSLAKITPESLAQNKEQVLKQLDGVEQFLDSLEGTKTASEFNLVLQGTMAPLMVLLRSRGLAGGPAALSPSTDTVTIVMQTQLDDKTDETLAEELLTLTDDPDLGLALSDIAEGRTKFEVSPVKDVNAFAKKIDFGKVVRIDTAKRLIRVKLKKREDSR